MRASFWPVVQAAIAASLAWLIAHRALGHRQPFFAPIAAAISLSNSHVLRSRRIVQMVGGVLLGIVVAEACVAVLGAGTVSMGVTTLITMLIAVGVAAGFVGEGMMFVNQAAASAILVVAFQGGGIGSERALDAVVGGACALVVGVLLFPAQPLPRIWGAERTLLDCLAGALHVSSAHLGTRRPLAPDWTMETGQRIHELLGQLATARMTARINVRVAPRRFSQRAVVDSEDARIARLDLLANAALSLTRVTAAALEAGQPVGEDLCAQLEELAGALQRLATTQQPWPAALLADVESIAGRAVAGMGDQQPELAPVVGQVLRATAQDLLALIEAERTVVGQSGE